MKIKIICIGKTNKSFMIDGETEYLKRLKHYVNVEKVEIPELKNAKNLSESEIKKSEGNLILQKIAPTDIVILLDENGKEYNSLQFSKYIQKQMNSGSKNLFFVVGGAYGFSEDIYSRANGKISLSQMTFSHQMVRMFFLEQIYRAFTILKGQPYHHR